MFFGRRRKEYHQAILNYMNDAHYPGVDNGACFGVAAMGLQAILLRDIDTYNKRIKVLEAPARSAAAIAIKNKRLSGYNIRSFLDGVAIYQNPHLYHDLFNRKEHINQDINNSSALVIPEKLKRKGGIVEAGHFSGVYTQSTLCETLKSLRKQFKHSRAEFAAGILLCKHNHALTIGFDNKFDKWVLIEANLGPAQWLTDHELSATLQRLFSTNENMIFDAKVFVAGVNNHAAKNIIAGWKLSATYLQHHVINQERAQAKDSYSATLLFIASQNGRLSTVKKLLENGADINFSSRNMPSALCIAALNGHIDVVNELLKNGASVSADYYTGVSPLEAAAISNHMDVAVALLDHGAAFNDISHSEKFLEQLRSAIDETSDIKVR